MAKTPGNKACAESCQPLQYEPKQRLGWEGKGPFLETVSKNWYWHRGSKDYGTSADWYDEETYKKIVWPIASDIAGFTFLKRPGSGRIEVMKPPAGAGLVALHCAQPDLLPQHYFFCDNSKCKFYVWLLCIR